LRGKPFGLPVVLFLLGLHVHVARADTTIDVSGSVVTASVKRFGINLGTINTSSGQVTKELVFRNPGFEGLIYRSVMRCAAGTANSCTDDTPVGMTPPAFTVWPDGFWNGASFEIIYGTARGRSGTVLTSAAAPGGTLYTFTDSGTAPATGDYILLSKTDLSNAVAGWATNVVGGSIGDETVDLAPDAQGRQAIRLTTTAAGQTVLIFANFDDAVNGQSFLQLNGNYRLTFKAKGISTPANLRLAFVRAGTPVTNFIPNQILALTNGWNTYTFDFAAAETGTATGLLQLVFGPSAPSELLLDDVSLRQIDSDPSNTTAFRDAFVNALDGLRPGLLRYLSGYSQLGDTLDNQLAVLLARQRAGFASSTASRDDVEHGLHEFLELAEWLGAEPWYVVPITFSPQEMAGLIEYLAGPSSSPYGAVRATRGHPAPWTDSFARIHLQLGNEEWNATFRGGSMEDPTAYGARSDEIFAAARGAPDFDASKFDLVLGGHSGPAFVSDNLSSHDASANHDSLALDTYFARFIDEPFTSVEELFGPLFAEPQMLTATGYWRQNYDTVQASTRPSVELAVYEGNVDTRLGSISQASLDSFTPSLGAGLGVAAYMLEVLREQHARHQMIYSATLYATRTESGNTALGLRSVVRDYGVTDRKRPTYLALQLANQALAGDLVQTTHSGDDPTWDQPAINSLPAPFAGAHYLQSFAFVNGNDKALILFNLHRTDPLTVRFSGVNAPSGAVTLDQLTAAAITDNNENAALVAPTMQALSGFDPAQPLLLPAYSMSVLRWQASGQCGSAPRGGCRTPSKSLLLLTDDPADDSKDRLVWKWLNGQAVVADLADPTANATYDLCLYDATGLLFGASLPPGGTCDGRPCWSATGSGYKYRDRDLTIAGIQKVLLKGSSTGRGKIRVGGKGINLPDPTLPLASDVTIQLVNGSTGVCFESVYDAAAIVDNDVAHFRGQTAAP